MSIKAYVRLIEVSPENATQMRLFYVAHCIGPEIATWNGNISNFHEVQFPILINGTETPNQVMSAISQGAADAFLASTGIPLVKTDIYLTNIVKGN